MVDKKITDLDAEAVWLDTDIIPFVKDPSGSPLTRSITVATALRLADGGLSVTGGVAAQALTTSFAKLTCFDTDISGVGVVPANADDQLQVPAAFTGIYWVTADLVWTGVSTQTYTFQVYWNSVAQGVPIAVYCTDANEHQTHIQVAVNANVDDVYMEVHAKADGSHNITVSDAYFFAQRIR